jgi:hypothetical protein
MRVCAPSALQRTPDRVAGDHVDHADHEVPGRILVVGETGRINAGDSERQG